MANYENLKNTMTEESAQKELKQKRNLTVAEEKAEWDKRKAELRHSAIAIIEAASKRHYKQIATRHKAKIKETIDNSDYPELLSEIMAQGMAAFAREHDKDQTRAYGLHRFIEACSFVTYLRVGHSATAAWIATFPKKWEHLIDKYGKDRAKVKAGNLAKSFKSRQAVMKVISISQAQTHLLYFDVYHEAIGKLTKLMRYAKSERVQMESAKHLLDELRDPMESQGEETANAITQLSQQLEKLSIQQKATVNPIDIVEGEFTEVNSPRSTGGSQGE